MPSGNLVVNVPRIQRGGGDREDRPAALAVELVAVDAGRGSEEDDGSGCAVAVDRGPRVAVPAF